MDKNDYRIETLSDTFLKHAQESERNHQESIKNHLESFPGDPLPEWMENCFNLAKALSVMAAEIDRLKTICNLKKDLID